MSVPPFNFHIKVFRGENVEFINGDHVAKIEYVTGGDQVTLTLSDGSKAVLHGTLAKDIIARCEGVSVNPI